MVVVVRCVAGSVDEQIDEQIKKKTHHPSELSTHHKNMYPQRGDQHTARVRVKSGMYVNRRYIKAVWEAESGGMVERRSGEKERFPQVALRYMDAICSARHVDRYRCIGIPPPPQDRYNQFLYPLIDCEKNERSDCLRDWKKKIERKRKAKTNKRTRSGARL